MLEYLYYNRGNSLLYMIFTAPCDKIVSLWSVIEVYIVLYINAGYLHSRHAKREGWINIETMSTVCLFTPLKFDKSKCIN